MGRHLCRSIDTKAVPHQSVQKQRTAAKTRRKRLPAVKTCCCYTLYLAQSGKRNEQSGNGNDRELIEMQYSYICVASTVAGSNAS